MEKILMEPGTRYILGLIKDLEIRINKLEALVENGSTNDGNTDVSTTITVGQEYMNIYPNSSYNFSVADTSVFNINDYVIISDKIIALVTGKDNTSIAVIFKACKPEGSNDFIWVDRGWTTNAQVGAVRIGDKVAKYII